MTSLEHCYDVAGNVQLRQGASVDSRQDTMVWGPEKGCDDALELQPPGFFHGSAADARHAISVPQDGSFRKRDSSVRAAGSKVTHQLLPRLAQVPRYKALLLKQRDIMIALTERLRERDDRILALQDEHSAVQAQAQCAEPAAAPDGWNATVHVPLNTHPGVSCLMTPGSLRMVLLQRHR